MPSYARMLLRLICSCVFLVFCKAAWADSPIPVKTVFIILMENHNWSSGSSGILGTTNCPYINNTLLPIASYCSQYYNPPGNHPSEPNYLWLVAGANFGILNDNPPSNNHQSSTNTLFTQLDHSGLSWKAYEENITGLVCPDVDDGEYAVRHDPFVFFDTVRNNFSYCTNHVRPYAELARDLQSNTVARYNFITPNLTNDMHDAPCSGCSSRVSGDAWLSHQIPKIMSSQAYSNNGAIFITWDEGAGTSDGPIGMIVLSPLAKGHGYNNSIHYTHSSTVRTMQNIFGLRPYLADAANATDLSDLFVTVPGLSNARMINNALHFTVTNLTAGKAIYFQTSSNYTTWTNIQTNTPVSATMNFTNSAALTQRFYRIRYAP